MKQYIDQEQYDLLSAEEQQQFIDWIRLKGDDPSAIVYRCSIGHLIWFLHDHGWDNLQCTKYDELCYGQTLPIDKQHKWAVADGDYEYATVSYHETELVDALWDAVQGVLRNKEYQCITK